MAKKTATYKKLVEPAVIDGRIETWARTDTLEVIAQKLGVSSRTLRNYRSRYSELDEALDRGRQVQVDSLKKSLYQLALGFERREKTKKVIESSDGDIDTVSIEKVEQIAPSLRAITILMSNLDKSFHADPDTYAVQQRALDIKEKSTDKEETTEKWEAI